MPHAAGGQPSGPAQQSWPDPQPRPQDPVSPQAHQRVQKDDSPESQRSLEGSDVEEVGEQGEGGGKSPVSPAEAERVSAIEVAMTAVRNLAALEQLVAVRCDSLLERFRQSEKPIAAVKTAEKQNHATLRKDLAVHADRLRKGDADSVAELAEGTP